MLIKMSCPDCEKVVEVSEIKKETNVDINGKNVFFLAPMCKCSVCGSEFQTMEQLEQSLKLAKIINEYPGAILGSCGVRYGASRTPDITSSYYTDNAGCLGVGVAYYQGYSRYDYGTAIITDLDAAIEDMNAAITSWNIDNVDYPCNKHYVAISGEICLVDGAPSNEQTLLYD